MKRTYRCPRCNAEVGLPKQPKKVPQSQCGIDVDDNGRRKGRRDPVNMVEVAA
jgi:hypothetical protein